jgi:hypothetical protein
MADLLCPLAADASPETAEAHYLKALNQLAAEAYEQHRMEILADVLVWTLARIIYAFGLSSAGDVLRRLGNYLYRLNAEEKARQEAADAAREGHAPH